MPPLNPTTPAANPAPNPPTQAPLDARTSLLNLRSMYTINDAFLRAIIVGRKGVGKTTLAETCVKPVLHLCFDPGGEQSLYERLPTGEAIVPDWLIPVAAFQSCDWEAAKAFNKAFKDWQKANIFSNVGTVIIDSMTTFGDMLVDQVTQESIIDAKSKGKTHKDGMELQDYGMLAQRASYWIKTFLNLPAHVIILGHYDTYFDENLNKVLHTILFPGRKFAESVDVLPSEFYFMLREDKTQVVAGKTTTTTERFLITNTYDKLPGSTRLGSKGRFPTKVPADIKALLKLAGLPTEDKPLIVPTVEPEEC